MSIYTVKDKQTGKVVEFQWNKETPPTQADMMRVFSAAHGSGGNTSGVTGTWEGPSTGRKIANYLTEMGNNIPGNALDIAKGVGNVITHPIETATNLSELSGGAAQSLAKEIPGVRNLIPDTMEQDRFDQARRRVSESLMNTIDDPGRIADFVKEKPVDSALIALTGAGGLKSMVRTTPLSIDTAIGRTVNKAFDIGINPANTNRLTPLQRTKYRMKAKTGVEAIAENKNNLILTDAETGLPRSGALPENLHQFTEAIDQTKRIVFEEYNELAKQAGKQGVTVDLQPIYDELMNIADNANVKKFAPQIGKYARKRAKEIIDEGTSIDVMAAQESLQLLNKTLEPFWKNPTFETVSRARIESLVAANLRKQLDDVIMNATGSEYSQLKKTYGSLKSIEKDVNMRHNAEVRKTHKGYSPLNDTLSSAAVIHGILSTNAPLVGAATAYKTLKWYNKWRYAPDKMVKDMFRNTEKLMEARRKLENR